MSGEWLSGTGRTAASEAEPPAPEAGNAKSPPRFIEIRQLIRARFRALSLLGGLFVSTWLVGALVASLQQPPRLRRMEVIAAPQGLLPAVERFEQPGLGAAILDSQLRLHVFSYTPPGYVLLEDRHASFGNIISWPGVGYTACGLDGELSAWDSRGEPIWQRSIFDDFGLESFSTTTFQLAGRDGRLYVLGGDGAVWVYAADGQPLESARLDAEINLAGPLLATSEGHIYYSLKTGEFMEALAPQPGQARQSTEYDTGLPGDPYALYEAVYRHREHYDLPMLFAARIDNGSISYKCRTPDGFDRAGSFAVGDTIDSFRIAANGNQIVVADIAGRHRIYRDGGMMMLTAADADAFTPLGDLRTGCDPESGTVYFWADEYESGAGWRLLNALEQRWPQLGGLLDLHGEGLLIYDPALHRNTIVHFPAGLQPLSWPDRQGDFLAIEGTEESARVLHCRLQR